jgi:hypothetical protein
MLESVNGFDWDEGNSAKCWNRVSQEEIEHLFQQQDVLILQISNTLKMRTDI